MKGFIGRLLRLLGLRTEKHINRSEDDMRLVYQPRQSSCTKEPQSIQSEDLSIEALCEPSNDTVPNLEILEDRDSSEEAGYDPYETTESYQWSSENTEK